MECGHGFQESRFARCARSWVKCHEKYGELKEILRLREEERAKKRSGSDRDRDRDRERDRDRDRSRHRDRGGERDGHRSQHRDRERDRRRSRCGAVPAYVSSCCPPLASGFAAMATWY
jgi:hypothetical protein